MLLPLMAAVLVQTCLGFLYSPMAGPVRSVVQGRSSKNGIGREVWTKCAWVDRMSSSGNVASRTGSRKVLLSASANTGVSGEVSGETDSPALKTALIEKILYFKAVQARDGQESVDFGVLSHHLCVAQCRGMCFSYLLLHVLCSVLVLLVWFPQGS